MKFALILILLLCIVIAKGFKLAPYSEINCPLIIPFKYNLPTKVLDLDGNANPELKTCVLKTILPTYSITLISGSNTNKGDLFDKHRDTENPNLVIMTKHIDGTVLELPSVRQVINSHRSALHIIVTDSTKFRCIDGAMNTTDFESLEKFMNKLWHIYKIMVASAIFPLSCPEKVVIYSGKRNTGYILYDRTIKLVDLSQDNYDTVEESTVALTEDYPLRANMFFRFPTSITNCQNLHYYTKMDMNVSQGYCGQDALVMQDIVKHFKFQLYFPKDKSCDSYGYASPNNISGSLGCIVRKRIDISFNSRFMTMYSEDYVYFLHYVTTGSLCALVKRPDVVPVWVYAFTVYREKLWVLIILLIIVIGIITWGVATIKHKATGKKRESFFFYIKDAFTSIMFGFTMKKHGKLLYILRGTCLCSSILFATIYQGHINYVLATLLRFESIKTLEQLYKSENTMYITPAIKEIVKQLRNPNNEQQDTFIRRSRIINENHTLSFLLDHPHSVLLGRKNDVLMEIMSIYKYEKETPLIEIVNECFNTYYLSFITRTGFPFYEEMQRFMQRVGEAGLPIIYYKWTCDMLGVPHTSPPPHREIRHYAKLTLGDQRVAFGILMFGHTASFIIFVIEIVKGRRRRINN